MHTIRPLEDVVKERPFFFLGNPIHQRVIKLIHEMMINCIAINGRQSCGIEIELTGNQSFLFRFKASQTLEHIAEEILEHKATEKNQYLIIGKILCKYFNLSIENKFHLLMSLQLDPKVFSNSLNYFKLLSAVELFTALNRNSEVTLMDNRGKYRQRNHLCFPEGILHLHNRNMHDVLSISQFEIDFDSKIKGKDYQFYLTYRGDWYPEPVIHAYANNISNTSGGSLIDGIISGFIHGLEAYVAHQKLKYYKIKKTKIFNGLILTAHVRGDKFSFGGSFKESLEDDVVKEDVATVMKKETNKFLSQNQQAAIDFLSRFDESQLGSAMFDLSQER
ncbi:MAG: hypothetical protein ACFB10_14695 [Salibacteraceae bacterium]